MKYQNTVKGFKVLVDGTIDIFFTASSQLEYAKEKNIELEFVPIGLEEFAFFVNCKNPIEWLTSQQIKDIYGCNITIWKDFGGANRAYLSSDKSKRLRKSNNDVEVYGDENLEILHS